VNAWFRDARCKEGEAKAMAADDADRRNKRDLAMALHLEAAEAFASVAINVPADYPNTRSDLAIAAVVSFACADRYDLAVRFARRMLAQGGMLSPRGRGELSDMVVDYEPLVPQRFHAHEGTSEQGEPSRSIAPVVARKHLPTKRANVRHRRRDAVRGSMILKGAA
jgi:hypothetical protein